MPDVEPRHSMGAFTTFFDREVVLFSPWFFFEKVVWRVLNDFINYLKRQARGWENWKFLNISPLFLWYMGNVYTTVEILWLDRAKPTWWINLSIFWSYILLIGNTRENVPLCIFSEVLQVFWKLFYGSILRQDVGIEHHEMSCQIAIKLAKDAYHLG